MENHRMHDALEYSVIVLLEEENMNFSQYIQTIHRTFIATGKPFEIIIVSNGKEEYLRTGINKLEEHKEHIKAFSLHKKTTQAVCLKAGFNESRGKIIVVCGSYQQISQDSFQALQNYLLFLDPNDWKTDFGVRFRGSTITIKDDVAELIQDYEDHREEIQAWVKIQ